MERFFFIRNLLLLKFELNVSIFFFWINFSMLQVFFFNSESSLILDFLS